MTEAEVYAALTRLFRQVFRTEAIELNAGSTVANFAGWDSFKFAEIIVSLEAEYDIEFDAAELDALEDIRDLARLVVKRVAAE